MRSAILCANALALAFRNRLLQPLNFRTEVIGQQPARRTSYGTVPSRLYSGAYDTATQVQAYVWSRFMDVVLSRCEMLAGAQQRKCDSAD